MKRFCLTLVVALLFAAVVFSQSPKECPTVWIDGPTYSITSDKLIVFTVRISNVNARIRPEYRWEVSSGTIISGQGTPSITVDRAGLEAVVVTASVSVGGLSQACPAEASRSVTILPQGAVCDLAFDQYGDIRFEDEKARLDNFAISIFNYKGATGYIIAYAGKQTYKGEAAERLLSAKNYLVKVRDMDPARIITVDGGYQEEYSVSLIIAPAGAAPPSAMPTLSPAEIELTKPRPRDLVKRKTRVRQ